MDADGFSLVTPEDELIATHNILCCECGTPIPPNPAAMCAMCIRARIDISEGIPKQSTVYYCRACERYLNPPTTWISCSLESRELLALCLKRLKGLNKVRLVDAGFVWTEPHSKRIKVKISIQKEVLSGAILQQVFVVEYVVQGQFCDQCHRREAQDTWQAVVQIRQKVRHKKTFFYLEQLIIKHHAHDRTTMIKACSDGLDFYFATKSDARKMVEFLGAVVPMRMKTSERLVSQDIHTSTYNFKYAFSIEIAPVCKDDVTCLPASLARAQGCISPLLICDRIGSGLHMVDPFTLQTSEVPAALYWRQPFFGLSSGQLVEYMVMDIEPVIDPATNQPVQRKRYMLADATVARMSDLGENDVLFSTRTHLGNLLAPGDLVWGFDMTTCNFNDEHANKLDPRSLPDVLLVKKSYTEKRKRHRRKWALKTLMKEEQFTSKKDEEMAERDMENFMQDLEEDTEYRGTVNIYKGPSVYETDGEGDDDLRVGLDEMLDDFGEMTIDPASVPATEEEAAAALILQQQAAAAAAAAAAAYIPAAAPPAAVGGAGSMEE